MATIEEMAAQYAQENYPDEPSCGMFGTGDYEPYIDMSVERERVKEDYMEAANAVLEKIESLIENTSGEGEVYHYNLYMGLQKLVKELKGE